MPTTAKLDALSADVAAWAKKKPLLKRVWLFGSRVRQDFRLDSDLDIAIELDVNAAEGSDESGGIALWMFDKDGWKEELQAISPYEVQLEQYLEDQTPTIKCALERSSQLVYEKPSVGK